MTEYIYDTAKVDTLSTQGFTGEEIIRCRDCRFCKPNKGKIKKDFPMWCEFIELDMGDADASVHGEKGGENG